MLSYFELDFCDSVCCRSWFAPGDARQISDCTDLRHRLVR